MSRESLYNRTKKLNSSDNPSFDPLKSVRKAIMRTVPGADNWTIIVPDWKDNGLRLKYAMWQENRLMRNVLGYVLDDNILSTDLMKTRDSMVAIADQLRADVRHLNANRVNWKVAGFGSVPVMRALSDDKSLPADVMDFTAPVGDLATNVWANSEALQLNGRFKAQGITFDDLKAEWAGLSPITQASSVTGAEVTVHISEADKIVRPDSSYQFAMALQEANSVTPNIHQHLGHLGLIGLHS